MSEWWGLDASATASHLQPLEKLLDHLEDDFLVLEGREL